MYECNPNVRQDLESIQNQILERIQYLREKDTPLSEDWALDDYYQLNSEIQRCILNDHTFSPITIGIIGRNWYCSMPYILFPYSKSQKKK